MVIVSLLHQEAPIEELGLVLEDALHALIAALHLARFLVALA
jgi:hypothetical protein